MKKILSVVITLVAALQAFSQGPPSYVPTNGLVGWWPFTGNAIDSSGNGNNGTVTGASPTSDRFGRSNSAYSFDGNADYINCGNASSLSISGSISISVWLYANNFNTDHGIVSKYNTSPAYDLITNSPYSIAPLNKIRWLDAGGFLFSGPINSGTWHHIVTVFNITQQKKYIYINGNLAVQSSVTLSAIPTNNNNLFIGAHQPSNISTWSWDGKLDDVGIWNRALEECEIKQLYLSKSINRPTLSIGKDTSYCKLDSVKITTTNGFKSYLWSTNDTSRSVFVKSSQKISVIATDSLGCKAYDTATISLLNPKISPKDTIVCKGSQVTLSNSSNTSNASCGYIPNSLKSGLVAWYPFCGNANDESGNGNHGTVNGASLTSDRFGYSNSAYLFDGINDYIQTSGNGPTGTGISVSYWFKSTQTALNTSIIAFGGNSASSKFEVLHDYTNTCLGPYIHGSFTQYSPGISNSNNNGSWHHAVVILPLNASSLNQTIIYVDGVLISGNCMYQNYGAPAPSIGSGNTIKFGMVHTVMGANYFYGSLDDIGIWNRSLTSTEVNKLYNVRALSTKLTWSTSDSSSTTKITANANTQVWLKVTDGIGTCYDTTNVYIRQPSVSIGADTIRVCKADSVQLSATKGFKSYLWNNGSLSDNIFIKNSEKISIKAIDSIGCLAYDTAIVSILNPKISPLDTVVCKSTQITLSGSINSTSSTNTTCGYMPSALKSGLVAWYPFCGNANDESGNGNHGTVNGASLSSDRFGNTGKAYSLNGVNNFINSSNNLIQTSQPHTISTWFITSDSNKLNQTIFNTNPHTLENLAFHYSSSSNNPPFKLSAGMGNGLSGVGSWNIIWPDTNQIKTPPTLSKWHNVVWVKSDSLIWRIYYDGKLIYKFQSNKNTGNQFANIRFGAENAGAPNGGANFKGTLDDIGIWNRALTATEIAQLYALQSNAYPPKLTWSTSDTTSTTKITPLATTKVWLKANNGIGVCYDTTSVIVSMPVINLQDTTLLTNCKRDSMSVNIGSKWTSINWSNGSKDSSTWLKTTGKYFVSAKDQYGCAASDSTVFINPGKPKITRIVADSVNCFGGKDGSLNASAAGGFAPVRYQWNDAAKQITSKASGLSKGSYKLIFSDAYNCKDSMSAVVNEPAKLLLSLVTSDSVNCFGGSDGSLKVSTTGGSGGNSYQWNDPNTQKTPLAVNLKAGIYKVSVSDIYGCFDTLTASVYQPKKVVAGISTFKNSKCYGYSDGSALGTGSGGTGILKYNWNTSPAQNTAQAVNLSKGTYLLTVTDVYGCYDTISANISEPAKIVPLISANRLAVRDIPHELSSFVSPTQIYTYQWTPSSVFGKNTNKPVINGKFQTTTLVTLRTTDNNGCFGEDTATITVLIPFGDFIPTVFSPNADKHNDVFGLPDMFEIEQLDIYNRWGELLFSGSASNPSWDGLYKGEIVPQGTYLYMVKASLKGTVYKFEHKGTISVVR